MRKDPHKHTDQEETFLERWSRKKSRTDDKNEPAAETLPQSSPNDSDLESVQSPDDKPLLTDTDMPPLDSLDEKSDYSGFMSEGVSEQLRQLALRKLFRSAGFNIRDGLDDYDDDFTDFAALGDLVTSDMKHQLELAKKRKLESEKEKILQEKEPSEQADEEIAEDDTVIREEQDEPESNADDIGPDELEQV